MNIVSRTFQVVHPNAAFSDTAVPKLALTRHECAQALGVSSRTVDQLIAGRAGNKFPVVHVGTKPLVPVDQLRTWLAAQVKGATP